MAALKKRKKIPLSQGADDGEDSPLTPRNDEPWHATSRTWRTGLVTCWSARHCLSRCPTWSRTTRGRSTIRRGTATFFKRRASAKAIQGLLRPGWLRGVVRSDSQRGRLLLVPSLVRKVGKVRLAVQPSWKKKRGRFAARILRAAS